MSDVADTLDGPDERKEGLMAGNGFKINKQGIDKFTRELQREFDKHPIRVPVSAEHPGLETGVPSSTTNYYGPVILGNADSAQLAWSNQQVAQTQEQAEPIAAGLEPLAQAIADILARLQTLELRDDELRLANDAGNEALLAMTDSEPDISRVRRGVMTLRGVLAPLVVAGQAGVATGTAEWAQHAVTQLGGLI